MLWASSQEATGLDFEYSRLPTPSQTGEPHHRTGKAGFRSKGVGHYWPAEQSGLSRRWLRSRLDTRTPFRKSSIGVLLPRLAALRPIEQESGGFAAEQESSGAVEQ